MKVLYAIQSTGNGHISRAKEIIPYLERRFQFDIMLSGPKNELDLGYPIKYHFKGVTFFYDKKGAINWPKTVFKNNILQFAKDVFSLRVQEYDLILTDNWMPVMDGETMLNMYFNNKSLNHCKHVYMYSANSEYNQSETRYSYFTKPLSKMNFEQMLNML